MDQTSDTTDDGDPLLLKSRRPKTSSTLKHRDLNKRATI